jgi:hypothetical protein
MSTLKTGSRLKSQVCDTQVIVVRAPATDVDLTCGGHPLVDVKADGAEGLPLDPAHAGGSPMGKRFTHPTVDGLEVLVTKAGAGSLADAGILLVVKDAKPLPASD